MKKYRKETLSVRLGDSINQASLYSQDVITPIHLTTTNFWKQIDQPGPHEYIRSGSRSKASTM